MNVELEVAFSLKIPVSHIASLASLTRTIHSTDYLTPPGVTIYTPGSSENIYGQ
jgi:hypothetical protein